MKNSNVILKPVSFSEYDAKVRTFSKFAKFAKTFFSVLRNFFMSQAIRRLSASHSRTFCNTPSRHFQHINTILLPFSAPLRLYLTLQHG